MAHFAILNKDSEVLSVVVIDNKMMLNNDGEEVEELGKQYISSVMRLAEIDNIVQTSYNSNFRKNFAGVGMIYDRLRDAFTAKQPFPSWTFNEDEYYWEPPTPPPESDDPFVWDEHNKQWIPVGNPSSGATLFEL